MSSKSHERGKKKSGKFPHAFVILFTILVLAAVCTWIIPAGQYVRTQVNGHMAVEAGSFTYVNQSPAGIMDIFQAIPLGLQDGIPLITMILAIGAAIGLVNSTGAIEAAVMVLSDKLGAKNSKLVLVGIMVFFMLIGAFPAMLEGTIPFAPVVIPVCLLLGYDVVTGIAIIFVSDIIGWSAGPANYYTVGNAQMIGGLPLFSGFGYRMICLLVLGAIGIFYTVRYAERVRKNPALSYMAGTDCSDFMGSGERMKFTVRRKLVFAAFIITILLIVVGCLKWGWQLLDMSGVYLLSGLICGILAGYDSGKIADSLLDGAKSVFIAAMAIGVARGISVIMENGKIIDTLVYVLSGFLQGMPQWLTSIGMMVVQTIINLFIPSGSSQALVTMPVLMPVADIVGMSKQLTILAFQFGDGLSNLCFPTMGALIALLSFARIPFDKWLKFIMPFMLLSWGACFLLLLAGSFIGY